MVEFMKVQSDDAGGVDHQGDGHGQVVKEWIASAIVGIVEMHKDEQARQHVAARLF
jgi:hypothetical protein